MTSAQPLNTNNQNLNNQNLNNNSFSGYQIGGSLPLGASSYIERQADRDLYDLLKAGECSYVFNSRQMGKSSLRVRVTQRLKQDGIRCATIDPQTIGTQLEQSQWYASVISNLLESFGLEDRFDLEEWWESRDWSSPVLCLHDFITKFLLVEIKAPIVIFVEEVDSLLNLAFKADDFFMLIRSLNDNRSQNPEYHRLTFALVGVATPMDLIQHEKHSAFNIGKAVEMSGFSLAEAAPLAKGLEDRFTESQSILKNVLDWTGGQPFLTQKLLSLVSQYLPENLAAEQIAPEIAKIVETHIIHNWESQDKPPHLTTIRDRIVTVDEKLRGQMLDCYRRILENEVLEATTTTERVKLRLTGLVVKRDNNLRSYNPIYAAVFNQAWVAQQLTDLRPAFYAAAFYKWNSSEERQKQDSLLRGQILLDAETWAKGKRLSDEDDQFLLESRELEKQEQERLLATERLARRNAEEANRLLIEKQETERQLDLEKLAKESAEQERLIAIKRQEIAEEEWRVSEDKAIILDEAKRKADRRVKVGSAILAVTLALAAGAGVRAAQWLNDVSIKSEETITGLENIIAQKKNEIKYWEKLSQRKEFEIEYRQNVKSQLKRLNFNDVEIHEFISKVDDMYKDKESQNLSKNILKIALSNRSIEVQYFFKESDSLLKIDAIRMAIENTGFKFKSEKSNDKLPVNSILYGRGVNSEEVKVISLITIRAGLRIKAIEPFRLQYDRLPLTIQIGSNSEFEDREVWTEERIQNSEFRPK